MDQATLVAKLIDDVPRLIDRIKEDNIEVKAVYWLYTSESDLWYLHIATELVDQIGITEAYKKVLVAMKQLPSLRIERFRLKLVSPADKVASAIEGFLRMRNGPSPTEIRSSTLDGIHIEHAFVY